MIEENHPQRLNQSLLGFTDKHNKKQKTMDFSAYICNFSKNRNALLHVYNKLMGVLGMDGRCDNINIFVDTEPRIVQLRSVVNIPLQYSD